MHELEEHLVCNGIDQSYTCWTWHGEKRNETADYDMQDSVRNTNPSKGESCIIHLLSISLILSIYLSISNLCSVDMFWLLEKLDATNCLFCAKTFSVC